MMRVRILRPVPTAINTLITSGLTVINDFEQVCVLRRTLNLHIVAFRNTPDEGTGAGQHRRPGFCREISLGAAFSD